LPLQIDLDGLNANVILISLLVFFSVYAHTPKYKWKCEQVVQCN